MDKELKCIICGAIATTFFLAHSNPVCDKCHKQLGNVPHTIEIQFPNDLIRQGEEIVITGTATTITTSTSSSSSSSTTTQPPETL
jgi:hypothetical protein